MSMSMMDSRDLGKIDMDVLVPAFAAATAVFLHAAVLKRYEIDHLTTTLCAAATAAYICFAGISGLHLATTTTAAFYGTLSTTILFYRAFFHPLRSFPGPFAARLSKWWTVKQIVSSDFHFSNVLLPQLRRKYGDYVRTGPRELHIFDPAAIQPILGFGARVTRGPFYDSFEGSLHLTRDRAFHRERRRVWDTGMKQLLTDFEPRLDEFTAQLVERLQSAGGKAIPLEEYCMHYTYDVTATLAFGAPMGLNAGVKDEESSAILDIMQRSMPVLGVLSHVPWFMNALATATREVGPFKQWTDWNRARLRERQAMKDPKPDLMQYLLAAMPTGPARDRGLMGECRLIIGAGMETSAAAMTFIFILLGIHQDYQTKLREELGGVAFSKRTSLPLLDAIINETQRLWPSILWPAQRVTPAEGLAVNGRFIPGGTIVGIPGYAMAIDERNFVQPEEWIPERWTTRPELCINKAGSMPFSTGPYSCAGKNLAMAQVRSVVASVVRSFQVVLPEDFDEGEFFRGVQDHFSIGVPKLGVRFVPLSP